MNRASDINIRSTLSVKYCMMELFNVALDLPQNANTESDSIDFLSDIHYLAKEHKREKERTLDR